MLFLTRIAGLSAEQVGIALTVGWAAGFTASTALGALADRYGLRRTAGLLATGTSLALLGLQAVGSLPVLITVTVVYGCCQSGLGAVRQALVTALSTPEQRTAMRARVQVVQNAGLAIGAAAGGIALALDTSAAYRAVLAGDAATFAVAAAVLATMPAVTPAPRPSGRRLEVLHDRCYAVLAG